VGVFALLVVLLVLVGIAIYRGFRYFAKPS
jgi:hypothetical protein